MKRPSRGARESATTTRHTGSFLPPTRVRRIATAIKRRRRLAPAHHGAEVGHLPLLEAAHHPAHLAELLDQLRDLLDGGARAVGDALAPPAVDDVGPAPLLLGHREDDRLDAVELPLVDLQLGE